MSNKIIFSAVSVLLVFIIYFLSINSFSFRDKLMEIDCSEIKTREIVETYVPKSNFIKRKAIRIITDSNEYLLKNNSEELVSSSFKKIESCKEVLTINFKRRSESLTGIENVFFNSIDLIIK
ncbi:hypothetical protein [Gracilimonas sp.]|uniref:hypothetical protein n=1 Tax=Gracilimonas sp. TaxID=1974203 RepID=UPI0032ED9956